MNLTQETIISLKAAGALLLWFLGNEALHAVLGNLALLASFSLATHTLWRQLKKPRNPKDGSQA